MRDSLNRLTPHIGDSFQTDAISIVPLPCKTSLGTAGYCLPTKPITGDNGLTTPESDVCNSGQGRVEACSRLGVDGVSFQCCERRADDLQKAASYLMVPLVDQVDAKAPQQSSASSANAQLVLSVAAIAAVLFV